MFKLTIKTDNAAFYSCDVDEHGNPWFAPGPEVADILRDVATWAEDHDGTVPLSKEFRDSNGNKVAVAEWLA